MAENFDLIFGSSASQSYSWNDSDYQNGWQTVGDTPPTREQFDALQRRNDTKAQELNSRLSPLEDKATADGRQTATTYAKGTMVTADGLPNGWLLECIVAGTTGTGALEIPSPLVIGGTIVDGTVTWKLQNLAAKLSISDVPKIAGFSGKQTFTSSGTFTPTITGNYKITLQGGGGGGSGAGQGGLAGVYTVLTGSGGGEGGHLEFYEKLTAGQTYSYTIGAGGTGGAAGAATSNGDAGGNGGASSITINNNEYIANGGDGASLSSYGYSGEGGSGTINGNTISKGAPGAKGGYFSNFGAGGNGGGDGGAYANLNSVNGFLGGGGSGGGVNPTRNPSYQSGGGGGDGYITFEWLDTSLL